MAGKPEPRTTVSLPSFWSGHQASGETMRCSGLIVWTWDNSPIQGKTRVSRRKLASPASGRSTLCVPRSPTYPQYPREAT